MIYEQHFEFNGERYSVVPIGRAGRRGLVLGSSGRWMGDLVAQRSKVRFEGSTLCGGRVYGEKQATELVKSLGLSPADREEMFICLAVMARGWRRNPELDDAHLRFVRQLDPVPRSNRHIEGLRFVLDLEPSGAERYWVSRGRVAGVEPLACVHASEGQMDCWIGEASSRERVALPMSGWVGFGSEAEREESLALAARAILGLLSSIAKEE